MSHIEEPCSLMIDCPPGITAEINARIYGLSKGEAFATLSGIIREEAGKADEATVRVAYACHQIERENLWTTQYGSLEEWRSSLGTDVEAINLQGRLNVERIKGYAKKIRKNWGVALETIVENPSRGLAYEVAKLSGVCSDKEAALQLMRRCRLSRQQDEPDEEGQAYHVSIGCFPSTFETQ